MISRMIRIFCKERDKGSYQPVEPEPILMALKVFFYFNLGSPRQKVEERPANNVVMTPSVNRKDYNNNLLPNSNKNLPPKPSYNNNVPSNNNVIYKLPPKPTPLIPSKQNNSIDYSRSGSRDKADKAPLLSGR